jgi:LysR family transcriptional regulator, low CO2-responsive transcriptional regulator
MVMNIAQLRAFHAVATEGGFTRAAHRLGISQPAVTVQVRAIEQAHGLRLFHRRGGSVELTDFGRELLSRTRQVFALLDEVDDLLRSAGALMRGRLELGADGPFAVMGLIAAFRARYPRVQIQTRMGNTARVLRDLEEGRTDLAVLMLERPDARLTAVPLRDDRLVALVPRGHHWARRRRVTLGELNGQPMLFREQGSATRALLSAALERAGVTSEVVLELGSREALREAVAAGLGIGCIFEGEIGRDDRHRLLAIVKPELKATQYLACLPERRELRAVQAFLALVDELGTAQPSQYECIFAPA